MFLEVCAFTLQGMCNVPLRSCHRNGNYSVKGENDTMTQMLATVGIKRQDYWNVYLRHV